MRALGVSFQTDPIEASVAPSASQVRRTRRRVAIVSTTEELAFRKSPDFSMSQMSCPGERLAFFISSMCAL